MQPGCNKGATRGATGVQHGRVRDGLATGREPYDPLTGGFVHGVGSSRTGRENPKMERPGGEMTRCRSESDVPLKTFGWNSFILSFHPLF